MSFFITLESIGRGVNLHIALHLFRLLVSVEKYSFTKGSFVLKSKKYLVRWGIEPGPPA